MLCKHRCSVLRAGTAAVNRFDGKWAVTPPDAANRVDVTLRCKRIRHTIVGTHTCDWPNTKNVCVNLAASGESQKSKHKCREIHTQMLRDSHTESVFYINVTTLNYVFDVTIFFTFIK